MSQPSSSGFSWSGTLQVTNIRTLYERCQRLRLTGLMRLKQGEAVLDLMWVGGEPIEGEGDQGTRSLPLWNNGEFSVEQRLPDAKGQLTTSVETTGPMKAGQAQAIYTLCADNVLSADVDIKRGNGELAQVRFTLGKAEAASLNGQSESTLGALSKLGAWTDGTYRLALRPLFGEATAAEAPVFKDKPDQSDDKFDFTGSVNVDPSKGPVEWPPALRDAVGVGAPVPMGASIKASPIAATLPIGAKAPAAAPSSPGSSPGASGAAIPPRLASTLVAPQKPVVPTSLPPPSSSAATVPMTSISRAQAEQMMGKAPLVEKKPSRALQTVGIVIFLLVLLTAGVFLGFYLVRAH